MSKRSNCGSSKALKRSRPDHGRTPGPGLVPQKGISTRFASTHFLSGQDVKIYMKAKDRAGASYTSSEVGRPVVNEALIYEISQFANQSSIIAARIALETHANHLIAEFHQGGGWTKTSFLSKLQTQGTALHLGSHCDSSGQVQADDGNWMYTSDFLAKRTAAVQNGVPPMNIVFLDACSVGNSGTPTALLHPFNPSPVDRAAVSFNVVVDASLSAWYGAAFWEALQNKGTVKEAKLALWRRYNKEAEAASIPTIQEADIALAGDPLTRIVGVYWPGPIASQAQRDAVTRIESVFD